MIHLYEYNIASYVVLICLISKNVCYHHYGFKKSSF